MGHGMTSVCASVHFLLNSSLCEQQQQQSYFWDDISPMGHGMKSVCASVCFFLNSSLCGQQQHQTCYFGDMGWSQSVQVFTFSSTVASVSNSSIKAAIFVWRLGCLNMKEYESTALNAFRLARYPTWFSHMPIFFQCYQKINASKGTISPHMYTLYRHLLRTKK